MKTTITKSFIALSTVTVAVLALTVLKKNSLNSAQPQARMDLRDAAANNNSWSEKDLCKGAADKAAINAYIDKIDNAALSDGRIKVVAKGQEYQVPLYNPEDDVNGTVYDVKVHMDGGKCVVDSVSEAK